MDLRERDTGCLGGVPGSREHVERLRPCAAARSLCVRRGELAKERRKGALPGPESSGPYERPSQVAVPAPELDSDVTGSQWKVPKWTLMVRVAGNWKL